MNFKVKSQSDVPEKEMPDSYYQQGIDGFISKWGYAVHSAANWRFFSLVLGVTNIILIGAVVMFAMRSTVVPYIVEIDNSTGAVISTSKLAVRTVASPKEVEYFLWQAIKKTRTLPKDIVVYGNNWNEARTFFSGATNRKMNEMAIEEQHQERLKHGETSMLRLKVVTPLANSKGSYNIRWTEAYYDGGGNKIGEYELEGFFAVKQVGLNDETVYANPLGIQIVDFNISKVNGNGK